MQPFADRVVLITGAGSGIGRQMARTLAGQGARIAAIDVNEQGLNELAQELSAAGIPAAHFAHVLADVTDGSGAVQAAICQLEELVGPTDILVACAGIARRTTAVNYQAEEVANVIRINLIGVSNSIAAVLPGMLQRRRGHLVALSSMSSYHGLPHMAAYCASKAGVNALMDSLRVELRSHGIATTTICPAWVRTPMIDSLNQTRSLKKLEVTDAVERIVKAIGQRRAYLSFPRNTVFQLRLLRYLPTAMSDWLAERLLKRILKHS